MDVEFTYQRRQSYREYLAAQHLKENFDVPVLKGIRSLIGSIEEIFKKHTHEMSAGYRSPAPTSAQAAPITACTICTVRFSRGCLASMKASSWLILLPQNRPLFWPLVRPLESSQQPRRLPLLERARPPTPRAGW